MKTRISMTGLATLLVAGCQTIHLSPYAGGTGAPTSGFGRGCPPEIQQCTSG